MPFDGIVTKAIACELQNLSGAIIDKVFEPNSNCIILGCYLNGNNYALNICSNPSNYRINLTTHPISNPKIAPNFCMVLRKHLIGLHIKNIVTNNLERVITIEFEGFNDIDDFITKKLIVELMGKHCNIILVDENYIIIDSLRHIYNEDSPHIVVPHIKYTYPISKKLNFLNCNNFEEFKKNISYTNILDLPISISNTYNGISKNYLQFIINNLKVYNLQAIYEYLRKIIINIDTLNFKFETLNNDYFLVPISNSNNNFPLNFFIDDFYFKKESTENFKTYRNTVLKLILSTLNKYNKRLKNINDKLDACKNMDMYRLYGELITSNLYKIDNKNINEITLENYYDNNNLITIPLDPRYLPNINAKRYFKKYNKLKNTLKIVSIQKKETLEELTYLESIVYELENATSLEEVSDIFDEISENVVFKDLTLPTKPKKQTKVKQSNLTKNKNVSFNPLKYTIDNYTLLVGRNNKENDYLTLKYAKKSDLWFHTKDIHGSHAVLLVNNSIISEDILIRCAEIVSYHSKAKFSENVPVDFCKVKYVKKPNGAKPGMVTYTNYSTLYVKPKK